MTSFARLFGGKLKSKFLLLFFTLIGIYILISIFNSSNHEKTKLRNLPGLASGQDGSSILIQKIHQEESSKSTRNEFLTSKKSRNLEDFNNHAIRMTTVTSTKSDEPATRKVGLPHKGKYGDVREFTLSRDPEMVKKQLQIKEMMKHAFTGYRKCAWGYNEVMPISCHGAGGTFPGLKVGASIIDSLDTLYIMDLMEEFNAAQRWVETELTNGMNQGGFVSVFEFNIRHLGGLLSAYALSGEEVFLKKAINVADRLLPAFNTTTGVPDSSVHLTSGKHNRVSWASGAILSEFGTMHLEFMYLSQLTKNPIYAEKVQKLRKFLIQKPKRDGLYPVFMDPKSGEWGSYQVTLGAFGDSFYEYIIKSYIQSGKKDKVALKMYIDAIRPVRRLLIKKSPGGLTYSGQYRGGSVEARMEHLTCFAGGMFALGAAEMPSDSEQQDHMRVGEELTRTCHLSYNKTKTGLGPESFRFDQGNEATGSLRDAIHYMQRPEVVESFFVLYRLTHDPKYREWGWQVVEAMEKYTRVRYGYSGILNVNKVNSPQDNVQQSFFLAETLKYLYLLFSDDELLPLDKWVFNTEAHPLPVMSSETELFKVNDVEPSSQEREPPQEPPQEPPNMGQGESPDMPPEESLNMRNGEQPNMPPGSGINNENQ